MTGKEFYRSAANGEVDLVQAILALLDRTGRPWCVIGGLAVNAYTEPVVSLDLDLVVEAGAVPDLVEAARAHGMKAEKHEHSVNLSAPGSDIRIQIQADPRYQEFLARARERTVLGHAMSVASIEDVLQGKLWAWADPSRRPSKRQKDLADILRMVETHPDLLDRLPPAIRAKAEGEVS